MSNKYYLAIGLFFLIIFILKIFKDIYAGNFGPGDSGDYGSFCGWKEKSFKEKFIIWLKEK